MAKQQPRDREDSEQQFRDNYGEDPAGAVFAELSRLWSVIGRLDRRLESLRGIVAEIDPERMDRLEMKESLKRIEEELSE